MPFQEKLNEERLQALLNLAQKRFSSEKELVDYALEEVVRITASTVGYLHFFNEDLVSLQLFTWSKDVLKHCTAAKTAHYPLQAAGIWADCVRIRKPVIHNDYPKNTDKKGYPEGHFPVYRHMSVPIFDGKNIVGVIGVGNKTEAYDNIDMHQMVLFTTSMWQILKNHRMEQELVEQNTILEEMVQVRTAELEAKNAVLEKLQHAYDEITSLQDIIPICANCKKIRDDKGFWDDVDNYLERYTSKKFSHGICPHCVETLYGDVLNN